MIDPTYIQDEIQSNHVWELAFTLSEIQNDTAPIGWSKYIWIAQCLLTHYDISVKAGVGPLTNAAAAPTTQED